MKIAILDKQTVSTGGISFDEISALGETIFYDFTPYGKMVENIGDAEAVICNKSLFTADVLRACKNLKYIGLFATGYNNIDIKTATELGITVCNVPDYSTKAVAQHTFALILEIFSRVGDFSRSVAEGGWIKSPTFSYFAYPTYELDGLTLGIIGFGNIGKAAAKIGEAFGMKVIVHTRTVPEKELFPYEFVDLKEVFSRADVLSLHCPLNDATKEIVNEDNLSLMKKSAVIINTSRGGLVDEKALAEALNSERIAGAGLDVLSKEPMQETNPLYGAKNCIITPHIAWAPLETRKRLVSLAAKNLKAFIEGNPINVVTEP